MLFRTANLHCGLSPKALKSIYEGALFSLLPHAAPVWGEDLIK